MSSNFYRVAAASPALNVADCEYNTDIIIELIAELSAKGVEMAVFPELCITGYTCADLFHNSTLIDAAATSLQRIVTSTRGNAMISWVGAPLVHDSTMYNCAIAVTDGKVLAVIPKSFIPTYNEFYEKRWWASGVGISTTIDLGELGQVPFGPGIIIQTSRGVNLSAEICEDLWATIPPSSQAALNGAHIIANMSASDDLTGKYNYLINLIKGQSARCLGAYVYASAGFGESTTDLVFDGKCIIAENGSILACSERWQRRSHYTMADIDITALKRDRLHINTFHDCRKANDNGCIIVNAPKSPDTELRHDLLHYYSPTPFVPATDDDIDRRASEIINIQTAGLARRLSVTHSKTAVIGISGGLDSTLALLVTAKAFDSLGLDRKGIIGVTMPGFGTTGRTHRNAMTMMHTLGVTTREISIVPAVNQHFSDIGHDPSVHDVTYENSQARQRTLLLMDIANQESGMVIGTGDLSELALGWATYNGDHMSMYGVNAGVPKTLVKYLVRWFALRSTDEAERDALLDVIDTPISPELIPADDKGNITQKTEDLVGPYELHDFFLYHTLRFGRTPQEIFTLARHAFNSRYSDETIQHWLTTFNRRFFSQQFKRSCMPDGPKVGSVCLSPRGDWRMPSDASGNGWK